MPDLVRSTARLDAARESQHAALCYLNAKLAIESNTLTGVVDGKSTRSTIVPSYTRVTATSFADGSGNSVMRVQISPTLVNRVLLVDGYTALVPSSTAGTNDTMYAPMAAAGFLYYRTVGVYVQIRCLDNSIDLTGSRKIVNTAFSTTYNAMTNASVLSLTYGSDSSNNIPGLVTGSYLGMEDPTSWRALGSAVQLDDYALTFVGTSLSATDWSIEVWSITQLLTVGNTLIPQQVVISDPMEYAVTVEAALEEVPQYSSQRVNSRDGEEKSWTASIGRVFGNLHNLYDAYNGARRPQHYSTSFSGPAAILGPGMELDNPRATMSLQVAGQIVSLAAQGAGSSNCLAGLLAVANECKNDESAMIAEANAVLGEAVQSFNVRKGLGRVARAPVRVSEWDEDSISTGPAQTATSATSQRAQSARR